MEKQIEFWKGKSGDAYSERNGLSASSLSSRVLLWSEINKYLHSPKPLSVLEVGANIGINLRALRSI